MIFWSRDSGRSHRHVEYFYRTAYVWWTITSRSRRFQVSNVIKDLRGTYIRNAMQKDVLDHGFVRLVDHMPQHDLDTSIVQAARVSYGDGTKTSRETEDFCDISLDTGTRHPSKWWNSSSTSKCPSTSPDNIFDTELPQLMSSPPATPSFRNSTTTPRSYEASPW